MSFDILKLSCEVNNENDSFTTMYLYYLNPILLKINTLTIFGITIYLHIEEIKLIQI